MIRSIGFPQNPSDVHTLKSLAEMLVVGSEKNKAVVSNVRWLSNAYLVNGEMLYDAASEDLARYAEYLNADGCKIPYGVLKGRGLMGRENRSVAACSGLVQAAIESQKSRVFKDKTTGEVIECRKPFTDDWTADGYLRWAISVGVMDYDEESDTCSLSDLGREIALADEAEMNALMGQAFLSYPPTSRVMGLLSNTLNVNRKRSDSDPQWTKFKLGSEIGFIGEAGFSSIPENMYLAEYNAATTDSERKKVASNREGTMDKHARMICSWLKQIGWVEEDRQQVKGSWSGIALEAPLACYYLTLQGYNAYVNSMGRSSHKKIAKNVYRGSLATKSPDAEYLCTRRAAIIAAMKGGPKSIADIRRSMEKLSMDVSEDVIKDDIEGVRRIGIVVEEKNGRYRTSDKINHLSLPKNGAGRPSSMMEDIDALRSEIKAVNHKYLALIEYSVNPDRARDFEQNVLSLLVDELGYEGRWLGGGNQPDGVVSECDAGLIIDTKAYSGGYNLPIAQRDEMLRYLMDYVKKDKEVNKTEWWASFSPNVSRVHFAFVSSTFAESVGAGLKTISKRVKSFNDGVPIKGGAITAAMLLLKADKIKRSELSRGEFLELFGQNEVIRPE